MEKAAKLVCCTLVCTLLGLSSFAQDFKPGKLIRANGDTLTGFIYNNAFNRNPSQIVFRQSENEQGTKYLPADIGGFVVNDQIFRSAIINRNAELPSPISSTPEFSLIKDTVFLTVLIDGVKSLSMFRDKSMVYNFYVGTDTGYQLLLYKKYLRETGGSSYVVDMNMFRNQLNGYLGDCPSIEKKISNTDYAMAQLTDLFNAYYQCKNIAVKYKRATERTRQEFGIFAGFTQTKLKFIGQPPLSLFSFPTSKNITAGIFLNIVLPGNFKKVSINNELVYSSYSTEAHTRYTSPYYSAYEVDDFRQIGASYIKMNNMVRFRIPDTGPAVFINAGISNGLRLSKTDYSKQDIYRFNSLEDTQEGPALPEFKKWEEVGFIAGLGGTFSRFNLELRWETTDGMIRLSTQKASVSRYSLLVGYRFK
jgi:hypothetical protein